MPISRALSPKNNRDDHRWDLAEGDKGYLPECEDAYAQKFEEWQARHWAEWLTKNLTFPFTVTRQEDDIAAHYWPSPAKALFGIGRTIEVLGLAEEHFDRGVMLWVRAKRHIGTVPLSDVELTDDTNVNFWPVREYLVWFANR